MYSRAACRAGQGYRGIGKRAWQRAYALNRHNVESALRDHRPLHSLLDLGCDDGEHTLDWARAAGATDIHGIEVVPHRAALARERGVEVVAADLGETLPYDDGRFDTVVSNQVIEHVFDTDHFVAEAFRVLRPGGIVVTSTENLASWHNIGALLLGWQPFSLANVSSVGALGTP